MTRLFTDGAETGGLLALSITAGSSMTTARKRSGAYSYQVQNSAVGLTKVISSSDEIYIRCGAYIRSNYENTTIIEWKKGTTTLGSIRFTPGQKMNIYIGTTLALAGTASLDLDVWHLLEVHIKIADAGTVEVKLNGILDSSYSGDTKPGGDTTIDTVIVTNSSNSKYVNFDDIAINDTTGVVDNSWCGDGHVIALIPNADGDSSDLVGSDGNSASNYALVDDVPHDTDTTYVESATGDDYDLYNLSASGLGATHVIQRVWTESIAKDTTTAGGQIKHVMKTNSTEYDSSAISLETSYALQKGAEQLVNPQSSAVWTPAELDALQVGVKIVA